MLVLGFENVVPNGCIFKGKGGCFGHGVGSSVHHIGKSEVFELYVFVP